MSVDRLAWKPGDVNVSQCVFCVHKLAGAICTAFPSKIPDVILLNRHDHHYPYPGDHGIRFQDKATAKSSLADGLRKRLGRIIGKG